MAVLILLTASAVAPVVAPDLARQCCRFGVHALRGDKGHSANQHARTVRGHLRIARPKGLQYLMSNLPNGSPLRAFHWASDAVVHRHEAESILSRQFVICPNDDPVKRALKRLFGGANP